MSYSAITTETSNRVGQLIEQCARAYGRTNTEMAHALLASKTMAKHGYTHAQKGHLSEEQGQAAIAVLNYWVGKKNEERVQAG